MLQTATIDKHSPFLGEECALCKDPFAPAEEIVICPEDGSRHHVRCWQANGNKCAAYGCTGNGSVASNEVEEEEPEPLPPPFVQNRQSRRVITRPSSSFGCGQSCLLIAIALSIILFSIACFGLWAIFDYLMLNVWDLPYRAPFSSLPLPQLLNEFNIY
jgi:hypothetical protein